MKAAGYTRVSTSGQIGPDKASLQIQSDQIEAYCTYKKWEFLPIYNESVASGATMDRPVLQRLLNDAAKKKFDVVIVADLSRFGRNTLHLKQNLEILKNNKVNFVSLRENIVDDDESPIGGLIVNILASIYEFERETIRIRTTENKMIRWKERKIFVGHPPFGYYWDKETQKVAIHEKEAETFRYIVEQYLDFDRSLNTICIDLNTNKVPTRRKNKLWFVPVISRILRHSVYWTGTIITNQRQGVKDHIDYRCDPLLSKARWEAIQSRLDSSKIRSGRKSKAEDVFLLHGMLLCGHCGSKLQVHYDSRVRNDGTTYRYYSCYFHKPSNAAELRRERCILPPISADQIETMVWERLLSILSANVSKTKIIDSARWEEKEAKAENKIKQLQDALKVSKLALERLECMLKKPGKFDPESFLEMRSKFEHEMTQYELELREATEEFSNLRKMREEEEKLIKFATDQAELLQQVTNILNNLPYSEKRRFVKGMLSKKIEVAGMPNFDWMENEDAEPPEKMPFTHWSDKLFVPFRFNWPLLQDILSKHLPPSPDGNGNLSPYRSAVGEIRAAPGRG